MKSKGKVLSKLGFQVPKSDIESIVSSSEGAIEKVLMAVKVKLDFQANPEALKLSRQKAAKAKEQKKREEPKKTGKENRVKVNPGGGQKDEQYEKQLFEKSQKLTELCSRMGLLEQKLKNCEELLTVKEEKIKILQRTKK